jgi:hypothetical protein
MEPEVAMLIHSAEELRSASVSRSIPAAAPTGDRRATHLMEMYSKWRSSSSKNGVFEVLAACEVRFPVSSPLVESPSHVLFGSPIFVALT